MRNFTRFLWIFVFTMTLALIACESDSTNNHGEEVAECTETEQRCQNHAPETCTNGTWLAGNACNPGYLCKITAGKAECREEDVNSGCRESTQRCENNSPEICTDGIWIHGTVCAKGHLCKMVSEEANCVEEIEEDTRIILERTTDTIRTELLRLNNDEEGYPLPLFASWNVGDYPFIYGFTDRRGIDPEFQWEQIGEGHHWLPTFAYPSYTSSEDTLEMFSVYMQKTNARRFGNTG